MIFRDDNIYITNERTNEKRDDNDMNDGNNGDLVGRLRRHFFSK